MLGERRYLKDVEMLVPDEKPDVLDVAKMPFPLSVLTMRKHYDKAWGKGDPDQPVRTWTVTVEYEVAREDEDEFEVEASSEEEAEELAREDFRQEHGYGHEILSVTAREVAQ